VSLTNNKIFGRNGLTKFDLRNKQTRRRLHNPEQHQALFEDPNPEKEAGTIGQVIKVGLMPTTASYKYNSILT
jgi:molecular chaperone GrpE (heat shock protein)